MGNKSKNGFAVTLKKITKFNQLGILLVLVALVLVVGINKPVFFSGENLMNVLRSSSFIFLIGIAMTYVLISGGLDLSVGPMVALGGILSSMAVVSGVPIVISILLGVAIGLILGAMNGFMIVKFRIPALIVTLGMKYIAEGLVLIITLGKPVYPLPERFQAIGQGDVLGIPNVVLVAIVLALIGAGVLKYTRYGRSVYAVGGNKETARLSGINAGFIQGSVYALTGGTAALAGVLMAARLNSAQPTAGTGYELSVIAAVIIGGTSMFGGSGNISGTLIGALLMTVIENGMLLLRISPYWQKLIVGVVIILAVGLDQYRRKRIGMANA